MSEDYFRDDRNIEVELALRLDFDGAEVNSIDDGENENPRNSKFQFDFPERIMLLLGLIAVAIDPLFFYVPMMKPCLGLDKKLVIVAVILRTSVDILHDLSWWSKSWRGRSQYSRNEETMTCINILLNLLKMRSNDNYNSTPSRRSSALGRAKNLLTWFENSPILSPRGRSSMEARVMAIVASLPLPQVVALAVPFHSHLKTWLKFSVGGQFVPRILRCYPAYMVAFTGLQMPELLGAAFNLLLFALFSHAVGGFWYLRSVERQMDCMKENCWLQSQISCNDVDFYCGTGNDAVISFLMKENCSIEIEPDGSVRAPFDYGMFYSAIYFNLTGTTNFVSKVSGSFWWGINQLSSSGVGIQIDEYIWDVIFAIFICFLGLILCALLVGNAELYLQSIRPSTVAKLKGKRERLHNWPLFFRLPKHLRKEVIMCRHFRWQEVSEINLESLLNNIPWQLRRKLKPYFCEKLFLKVKEFEELNQKMKEELQQRASAVIFQAGTKIYKEGYPIYKMIHMVQGKVLVFNSNDAKEGLPAEELKENDSFGEELLLKALESPCPKHPLARKTIQAGTKVEAFALSFDDFTKVFTKYGRSMEPYRKEWAANAIQGAVKKFTALRKWEKLCSK